MEKIYRGFSKVNSWLLKAETLLGCLCLGLLFFIMTVNAALRYLFQSGINWSDEINGFLFVWFGFLAACHCMGRDGHLNVSAFVAPLPSAMRFAVKQLLNALMIFFCAIYIGPLFQLMAKLPISNVMRIPLEYIYAVLPVSFVLLIFHILHNIFKDTYFFLQGRRERKG